MPSETRIVQRASPVFVTASVVKTRGTPSRAASNAARYCLRGRPVLAAPPAAKPGETVSLGLNRPRRQAAPGRGVGGERWRNSFVNVIPQRLIHADSPLVARLRLRVLCLIKLRPPR